MKYYVEEVIEALKEELSGNPQLLSAAIAMLTEYLYDNESIELILDGYEGTWYCVDKMFADGDGFYQEGNMFYLMESCNYGDEAACIILDGNRNVVLDDVWNGFPDLDEYFERKKEMVIEAMEAGGYSLDEFSEGIVFQCKDSPSGLRFASFCDAEKWLEGAEFEDPEAGNAVGKILHPERF